jgi:acetylornithine deacetylase
MAHGGGPPASSLPALEREAAAAVDEAWLLDRLADLVAVPSVAGREGTAQELMARWMESLGMEVDRWELDLPALREHPAYSADVEREEGLGVVGTFRGDAGTGRSAGGEGPERREGATLVLNGHVDVVPAGEETRWSAPPFETTRRGTRVLGRGTADMKGALCAALAAIRALRESGIRLAGALQLQSVIGEEDGGVGTLAALERGHRGDGAVVMEPTRLAVAPAQAGALTFRVTVPGRAAHGALREEGIDPVEKFLPLYRRILALEEERNRSSDDPLYAGHDRPFAICVGKVRAGIWASTVAEELVFEGRYGVAPDEELPAARRALEEAVAEAAGADPWLQEHPPRVEWTGAQFAPARTPRDARIVTVLEGAAREVLGRAPEIRGMTYGADMRLLVNEGEIPTVLFGPGDVRDAHRPDEGVEVEELVACARTLAVTAMRFCGVR